MSTRHHTDRHSKIEARILHAADSNGSLGRIGQAYAARCWPRWRQDLARHEKRPNGHGRRPESCTVFRPGRCMETGSRANCNQQRNKCSAGSRDQGWCGSLPGRIQPEQRGGDFEWVFKRQPRLIWDAHQRGDYNAIRNAFFRAQDGNDNRKRNALYCYTGTMIDTFMVGRPAPPAPPPQSNTTRPEHREPGDRVPPKG